MRTLPCDNRLLYTKDTCGSVDSINLGNAIASRAIFFFFFVREGTHMRLAEFPMGGVRGFDATPFKFHAFARVKEQNRNLKPASERAREPISGKC